MNKEWEYTYCIQIQRTKRTNAESKWAGEIATLTLANSPCKSMLYVTISPTGWKMGEQGEIVPGFDTKWSYQEMSILTIMDFCVTLTFKWVTIKEEKEILDFLEFLILKSWILDGVWKKWSMNWDEGVMKSIWWEFGAIWS